MYSMEGIYMVMSYIWLGFVLISLLSAAITGRGALLSAAILEGAQSGIQLGIAMAGGICLWSGLGRLMEAVGLTASLSRRMQPLLHRIFPSTREDPELSGNLSANICANFLGLGNAATPMGIRAAKGLKRSDQATDELCRLIVLNTASIQLIPANVAALRVSLGCASPFDILPGVWVTSMLSAGGGLAMAWVLGKLWPHD